MLALKGGDRLAFDALYSRWQQPIYRFTYRMLRNTGAAEEVTQEVFIRVYRARERYMPEASFRCWLFRIAANLCSNERRRASVRLEVASGEDLDLEASGTGDPGLISAASELSSAVDRALDTLPERQRAAVLLARYEGCSMAEIGEILEISAGAAKLLLHRAREQLKRELSAFLPAEQEAP